MLTLSFPVNSDEHTMDKAQIPNPSYHYKRMFLPSSDLVKKMTSGIEMNYIRLHPGYLTSSHLPSRHSLNFIPARRSGSHESSDNLLIVHWPQPWTKINRNSITTLSLVLSPSLQCVWGAWQPRRLRFPSHPAVLKRDPSLGMGLLVLCRALTLCSVGPAPALLTAGELLLPGAQQECSVMWWKPCIFPQREHLVSNISFLHFPCLH